MPIWLKCCLFTLQFTPYFYRVANRAFPCLYWCFCRVRATFFAFIALFPLPCAAVDFDSSKKQTVLIHGIDYTIWSIIGNSVGTFPIWLADRQLERFPIDYSVNNSLVCCVIINHSKSNKKRLLCFKYSVMNTM